MTYEEFFSILEQEEPDLVGSDYLEALWYDAHGDWTHAHAIVQNIDTPEAAWIHAYLHRKEGDLANASFWYHKGNRVIPAINLPDEWEQLVKYFIEEQNKG